jgi:hypothetical protein
VFRLSALAADAPSGAIPSNPAPATNPEAPNANVERTLRRVIMIAAPVDDAVDRSENPGDELARVRFGRGVAEVRRCSRFSSP